MIVIANILYVLIFLVVIIVLVLVHELGHFIVAKLSGMRVDEFGIGFPPRAFRIAKIGETEYTLNWLPFGGFVRIYGEDGIIEVRKEEAIDDGNDFHDSATESLIGEEHDEAAGMGIAETQISPGIGSAVASHRSFIAKPRILQALTLVAGVGMNWLLAFVLLTITLIIGTPQAISAAQVPQASNVYLAILGTTPGSPAAKAGFQEGDKIVSSTIDTGKVGIGYTGNNPLGLSTLISTDTNKSPMIFVVDRNGKQVTLHGTPVVGAIAGDPKRVGMGFSLAYVGTIKTSLAQAPLQGLEETWNATILTLQGFWNLLKGLVTFSADLSQVAGPIGIEGVVGQAATQGISAILSLAALISINLAIVNLIPIPALDGGRLLFVIIESITRKPIPANIANRVNGIGFALLILLIIVISGHDLWMRIPALHSL